MGEQIEDVCGAAMNYADHSEVMAHLKTMKRNDDFYFGSIDANGFMVAIYAGILHYVSLGKSLNPYWTTKQYRWRFMILKV